MGTHVSPDELAAHFHAVVYAHGATAPRRLDVPGEDLANCLPALSFVHWYNGHPDAAHLAPDLSGRRAVVVGNGNVALDVARILLRPAADLGRTDIADRALTALRTSNVEEVVVLGRRGPAHAAFTTPELIGLMGLPELDVVVDADDDELEGAETSASRARLDVLRTLGKRPRRPGARPSY